MDELERLERSRPPQNRNIPMTQKPSSVSPDNLHRGVKMALDAGEVESVAEGYSLFERYRVSIMIGSMASSSRAHQAALLTMVNAGRRSLLGGVSVVGCLDVPLLIAVPGIGNSLSEAVMALGGRVASEPLAGSPKIILGDVEATAALDAPSIVATFDGWRGGVAPADECQRLMEGQDSTLGAVLAGALAVSEVFQFLRGYALAARRTVGLSLWNPEMHDWRVDDEAPIIQTVPSRLWLIGLGHLGQAFLWMFSMFDVDDPRKIEITLQDTDRLTEANDSTSMLSDLSHIGHLKTRVIAEWLEARGFSTRIVERKFDGDLRLADDEPLVGICGVDNLDARAALDDAGFGVVVEAGLGAGPEEYVSARVHSLPASITSREKWGGLQREYVKGEGKAYDTLLNEGTIDACGLVQLATRTVGAPFVGVVTGCIMVAELLRRLHGGIEVEVIDLSLKSPTNRTVVESARSSPPWRYGFANVR